MRNRGRRESSTRAIFPGATPKTPASKVMSAFRPPHVPSCPQQGSSGLDICSSKSVDLPPEKKGQISGHPPKPLRRGLYEILISANTIPTPSARLEVPLKAGDLCLSCPPVISSPSEGPSISFNILLWGPRDCPGISPFSLSPGS